MTIEEPKSGREIPEVKLTKTQEEVCNLIVSVTRFFFKKGKVFDNPPFRGFLLEGPPGNGKTEIAKQAVRRLSLELGDVRLNFIDSARIAAPKWGEAEKNLRDIFCMAKFESHKNMVLLFDDIDCLMIKRGSAVAKEWHYSLNSLVFHEIDNIEPYTTIIIATTNRPGLIDHALRSRLYSIEVPPLPLEELKEIAHRMIAKSVFDDTIANELIRAVYLELEKIKDPTIRDVQHIVVTKCITMGAWKA